MQRRLAFAAATAVTTGVATTAAWREAAPEGLRYMLCGGAGAMHAARMQARRATQAHRAPEAVYDGRVARRGGASRVADAAAWLRARGRWQLLRVETAVRELDDRRAH